MPRFRFLKVLTALVVFSAPTWAAGVDLSKIDRSIAKEPTYQTKTPKYCLLVYGPEAATRVWLVLDGETLYVDRNGNGDLTEKAKQVNFANTEGRGVGTTIEAGEIAPRPGVPKNTKLQIMLHPDSVYIYSEAEGRPWQRAGRDMSGNLKFGDKPQSAPIIHFNGPIAINPDEAYTLARSGQPTEFYTMLGTLGLGKGSFACIGYQEVPKDVHPEIGRAHV